MLNAVPLPKGPLEGPSRSQPSNRSAPPTGGAQGEDRSSFTASLDALRGRGQQKKAADAQSSGATVAQKYQRPAKGTEDKNAVKRQPADETSPATKMTSEDELITPGAPSSSLLDTDLAAQPSFIQLQVDRAGTAQGRVEAATTEGAGGGQIRPEGPVSRNDHHLPKGETLKAAMVVDTDAASGKSRGIPMSDADSVGLPSADEVSQTSLTESARKPETAVERSKMATESLSALKTNRKDAGEGSVSRDSTQPSGDKALPAKEAGARSGPSNGDHLLPAMEEDAKTVRPAAAEAGKGREVDASLRDIGRHHREVSRPESAETAPHQLPKDDRASQPGKTFGDAMRENASTATMKDDPGLMAHRPTVVDGSPSLTSPTGAKPAALDASISGGSPPSANAAEAFAQENFHQLVEKALFSVRGKQSEARIALKPDQLGHVHMRIVTENHVVSIKIVTETPAARELIDANAHQLRSELQQQGLNVQTIEVAVSDDHQDAYRGARQREAFRRQLASPFSSPGEDDEAAPGLGTAVRISGGDRVAGIDYFA